MSISIGSFALILAFLWKYKNIEQEEVNVPDWHKELVLRRLENYKKNPGSVLDFDAAMDDIGKECNV